MASEQIVIEYIAQVEGMRAQLKTVEASLKRVETTGKESAKNTQKSFQQAGESIKQTATQIAGALGLAFGVAQVIAFGKESVKAFAEAEVNANKLKFAVTKISGETETAFRKLIEQSAKLQKTSIFSDDSIQQAQTMLLTLGLNSKQTEDLIPKILDLASATGQDLGSATQSIIQGINGQTRGLKAVGLEFDATQDKTQNLAVITEKLNRFVGATGEALNTTTGKAKRFENAIDDIKESIGEVIVNQGNDLLDFFDALGEGFDKVALRNAKGILADSFKEQNDKIINDAQTSEKRRQELIAESNIKIVEIGKKGEAEQDFNRKSFLLEQLKNEQHLNLELQKLTEKRNGLGVDEKALEDAKKAAEKKKEDAIKAEKERIDAIRNLNKDAANQFFDDSLSENTRNAKEKEKAIESENDLQLRIVTDGQEKIKKTKEDIEKEITENLKKEVAERQAIQEAGFAFVAQALDAINQINQNNIQSEINGINEKHDADITALDDQLKNKVISQEQYDKKKTALDLAANKKESELKRQAFEADKQAQEIQVIIATALGVAKAIPNPYLMAFAAAAGLIQLAVINSQPTPKFSKGGLVGGKRHSEGGTLIEAEKGEFVNSIAVTNKHHDLLEAMQKGREQKYIQDFYVAPILRAQMKKQNENKDNSFASNIANSLALNSNFKDGNLLDSLKQSRKADRDNIIYLAKVLKSNGHNSRKW